jgi:uncharacterized protein YdaL
MSKALYLILLSTEIDREELIKSMENKGIIETWFFSFPNSFFIRSDLNSMELGKFIDEVTGNKLNFITIVTNDYYGRLSKELWEKFDKIKY